MSIYVCGNAIVVIFSVENETHCDFVKLREMLIRTNMEDMREQTHMRHYELYRKTRLEQVYLDIFRILNAPFSFGYIGGISNCYFLKIKTLITN